MRKLLIVFCKNPVLGKVKTRLAKSIGDSTALSVYNELLDHSLSVAGASAVEYAVYYDDFIDVNDRWNDALYKELS